MSGLSPLVDTLLATRLAQRVDLVPLKPEVQVAGPGRVTQVEEVTNDVRLPSRAAVEQQIGVGSLKIDQRGQGSTAAQAGPAVTLSGAARTLSAILDGQTGAAARVVGSEPLLAPSQSPSPSVIAATLARTVGQSGLFYESHLAQFAAGARSLAELAQEPQARLVGAIANALGTHRILDVAGDRVAQPVASPSRDAAASASDPGKPGGASALPAPVGPESAQPAPAAPADAAAQAHKNAYASIQEADRSTLLAKNHDEGAAPTARSSPAVPAGIHPEALALVRQQLELLAQPCFRWSGEAWPAVPLDWEIHRDEHQAAAGDDAAIERWSTRLALTLPTLGDIEVRISLAGSGLQVRLAASDNATLGLLRETRDALPASLRESGLELTELQIGPLAPPDAGHAPQAADGA